MFKIISANEFNPQIFEEYSVWSEHYDYDEIEEIISWGVDEKWLLDEIKKKHTGNDHCYYPVLKTNPFPKMVGLLYIKAKIYTKNGLELDGYVVSEDAYAVCLFINGEQIIFNKNIPLKSQINNVNKLEDAIQSKYNSIFPLRYATGFFSRSSNKIEGIFVLERYPHILNNPIYYIRSYLHNYSSKKLGGK